jgi:hypothetical protein
MPGHRGLCYPWSQEILSCLVTGDCVIPGHRGLCHPWLQGIMFLYLTPAMLLR